MKALVKTQKGTNNIELRDVPVPEPGDSEVLIRVYAAGVCGTDVHIQKDRFPFTPPVILGHEFSGVVEKTGRRVKQVRVGDRVISENNPMACGVCRICREGYPNICPAKRAMGIHSDGCFAEFVKLPEHLLHRLPAGVSLKEAVLSEPLAVAVHSVTDRCGVRSGDIVIVMGPGAIGLLAAQVAMAEGAGRVILTGVSRDVAVRFACAEKIGLETCNVEKEDLKTKIMAATNGLGADVVVEASGAVPAIQAGIDLLRRGGRMAISGLTAQKELALNWNNMVAKALTLTFAYSSRKQNWDRLVKYLAEKRVQTLPLITHCLTLDKWQEAFNLLDQQESIRAIFLINPELK